MDTCAYCNRPAAVKVIPPVVKGRWFPAIWICAGHAGNDRVLNDNNRKKQSLNKPKQNKTIWHT